MVAAALVSLLGSCRSTRAQSVTASSAAAVGCFSGSASDASRSDTLDVYAVESEFATMLLMSRDSISVQRDSVGRVSALVRSLEVSSRSARQHTARADVSATSSSSAGDTTASVSYVSSKSSALSVQDIGSGDGCGGSRRQPGAWSMLVVLIIGVLVAIDLKTHKK